MALKDFIKKIKSMGIKGCLLTLLLLVVPILAMAYWSSLSRDVYLTNATTPFWIAAVIGPCVAIIVTLFALAFFHRRLTLRQLAKLFAGTAFFIGVLSLQLPSALVRYLPHHRIQYLTDYDISFPGPSRGKSGRCEMGLWIKDRHLNRWIQFCSSRAWRTANCEKGMDSVEVVEEVNRYGVRIVNYWCAWSPIKK